MEHDDKVRNELQRLLDEINSATGNQPAAEACGTRDASEGEFSKEDQKILRRMLIRI